MTAFTSPRDRAMELLADRALQGLDLTEQNELDQLLEEQIDLDPDEMELAAAALNLAFLGQTGSLEPMPSHLRERLRSTESDSPPLLFEDPEPRPFDEPGMSWPAWSGWLVAVAAALVLWVQSQDWPTPTAEERYQQMLASAPSLLRMPWKPLGADEAPAGEVIWNASQQAGFLRIEGLERNDPDVEQYQLWIFDREQDDRYPVDGGVFDVESDAALIPIDAKIGVREPWQFVITIEKPGGVVVSDRQRIAALASGP